MIPGMGINSRQMNKMMKQLGIQSNALDAEEVIIRTKEKELVVKNPSVMEVKMAGQTTFQVSGVVEERGVSEEKSFSDQDVEMVVEKTGVGKEKAAEALEKNKGDIAAAILDLTG